MDTAYEAALQTVRLATAKWSKVQAAYRAREIGDAEYLAARKEYEAAEAAYEIAYEAAASEGS